MKMHQCTNYSIKVAIRRVANPKGFPDVETVLDRIAEPPFPAVNTRVGGTGRYKDIQYTNSTAMFLAISSASVQFSNVKLVDDPIM